MSQLQIHNNYLTQIVVLYLEAKSAKGSKLMFVNQGIAQIRRNYEQYGNESNTMVLFIANYSKGQINETKKAIEQYGATLILVNSAQDFIEYINNGNDRQNDKITNMTIFSHGLPGSIDFGYGLSEYATSYKLDKSNVSKLRDSAFKGSKSSIMSYACRSGLGPGYGVLDFDSENSIAQLMANSTKTNVGAFLVKTDYSNTLGNVFQRRIGNATSQYETVDNAILTPHGALSPVIGGSTPWYYLPLPQLFKPQNR